MSRLLRALVLAMTGLVAAACGGDRVAAQPPRAPPHVVVLQAPAGVPVAEARAPAPSAPPEHWYFEQMSPNGRHALLRRLDAVGRTTMQTRIVDVDSGAVLEEVTTPELAKFPSSTIGRSPAEIAKLDGILAAAPFAEDLLRGAHVASAFPFGSCGRLSAAPNAAAIAFNAGDWLYVADAAGRVKKKLAQEAAYDPRFTADGKHLFFRRATGALDKVFAKYELFVMPSDLSQPPRVLPGTAGVQERFTTSADGKDAIVIASHEPQITSCVLSVGLRPPFSVKRLGCLDGREVLVESAVSPKARWAALTTQTSTPGADDEGEGDAKSKRSLAGTPKLAWRLRVIALASGQVVYDVPAEPGFSLRAISDAGILVQSGVRGVVVDDVPQKKRRVLEAPVDLGHRAFFRSGTELVVLRGGGVAVVDLRDVR